MSHPFGYKHSEETKQKISLSLLGHSVSTQTRNKLFIANKGKAQSEATKEKNRQAQIKRFSLIPLIRHKKICAGCGIEFLTSRKEKIYCSAICYKATNKNKFAAYLPNHTGKKRSEETKIKMSLAAKGKVNRWKNAPIRRQPEQVRAKMRANNARAMLGRTGSLSGNWKGGKTKIRQLLPGLIQYKIWRKKVFERDNFTCQRCGLRKSGYIEAHHILELYKLIDEYQIQTSEDAIKCRALWDINNGQALCIDCHNLTRGKKKCA